MSIWVFIGRETGMPREVQKCDFQPTICPCAGDWIEYVPVLSVDTLTEERDTQVAIELRKDNVVAELRSRLAAAEKVIHAARSIRDKFPGGKMLWFSEFSAFEEALKEYDALKGGG